ncbi:hypothetical protein RRSWK_06682 [Rhodopirellula sp. SWK7]|nr:hypothetical protein RRSWK_06682 [Rhodopirellula sp. SWK7]
MLIGSRSRIVLREFTSSMRGVSVNFKIDVWALWFEKWCHQVG